MRATLADLFAMCGGVHKWAASDAGVAPVECWHGADLQPRPPLFHHGPLERGTLSSPRATKAKTRLGPGEARLSYSARPTCLFEQGCIQRPLSRAKGPWP